MNGNKTMDCIHGKLWAIVHLPWTQMTTWSSMQRKSGGFQLAFYLLLGNLWETSTVNPFSQVGG